MCGMYNASIVRFGKFIPSQLQTQTDVHVFAVHAIGLIKALQLFIHLAFKKEQGGIDPIRVRKTATAYVRTG